VRSRSTSHVARRCARGRRSGRSRLFLIVLESINHILCRERGCRETQDAKTLKWRLWAVTRSANALSRGVCRYTMEWREKWSPKGRMSGCPTVARCRGGQLLGPKQSGSSLHRQDKSPMSRPTSPVCYVRCHQPACMPMFGYSFIRPRPEKFGKRHGDGRVYIIG
jgi:hypothetical protein